MTFGGSLRDGGDAERHSSGNHLEKNPGMDLASVEGGLKRRIECADKKVLLSSSF